MAVRTERFALRPSLLATAGHAVLVGGLLAAVSVSLLSGCGSTETEGDAKSKRPSQPRVPEEELRSRGLETIWYFPPDAGDNPVASVELLPEGLFVATRPSREKPGRLKLFSRTSGSPVWYVNIRNPLKHPPSVYRYPPSVTGKPNEVYYADLDTVHCVDLRYGDELWSAELLFPISTRIVADELNYFVGSDTGRAYGIQKKNAVEEWTFRTGDSIHASPVVHGSSVLFASTDNSVYRLFSAQPGWITGSSWQVKTGSRIVGDPVVFSRWVLVGSTDYKLYCLEAQDGSAFWSFQAEAPIEEAPVVFSYRSNQEYAYCVAVRRNPSEVRRTLFSVKLRDGQEVWRREGYRSVVGIGKRSVYAINDPGAGGSRFLVALDVLTGEEQFKIPVDGFDFVPLNSADSGRDLNQRGKIFMVAQDGTIQVIGERT